MAEVKEKEAVNGAEPETDKTLSAVEEVRPIAGLKFDISSATVEDMDNMLDELRSNDLQVQCKLLARFAESIPNDWGDIGDELVFYRLPWKTFSDAKKLFMKAVDDYIKN